MIFFKITVSSCGTIYSDATVLFHPTQRYDFADVIKEIFHKEKVAAQHNMSFDEKIVGAEFLRNKMQDWTSTKRKICTMQSTTNLCAIHGPYGYKWPKLSELYFKLFRTGFEESHNAAVDIHATAKCFWELRRLGKI